MPLEFYKEQGIPEEPNINKEREREVVDRLLNRPDGKSSPEMEAALSKIDFQKLENLFYDIAQKYGIDRNRLNFLGAEKIFGTKIGIPIGSYSADGNIILIEDLFAESKKPLAQWQEEGRERSKEIYGSLETLFLAMVVHEETHAVARNFCVGRFTVKGWNEHSFEHDESGYHKRIIHSKKKNEEGETTYAMFNKFFVAFNEGITERLSRHILTKYCDDTNWPPVEIVKKYKESISNNVAGLNYNEEIDLVSFVLGCLSRETGQDEDFWWDKIVEGYFRGGFLDKPETQELLRKAVGPEFLSDISRLDPSKIGIGGHEVKDLIKKYKKSDE